MKTLIEIAQDLKLHYPNLSDYELLSIAVQLQRNLIIQAGTYAASAKLKAAIESERVKD